MLIVTQGKVVINHAIYEPGDVIDCLTPDEESRMVAEGIADRFDESAEATPEAPASKAKEPTTAELKARCRELGLPANGKKSELQARIEAAESELEEEPEDDFGDDELPDLTPEVPR